MTNATVKRGRGYEGLSGFEVVNPDGQKYHPGKAVMIIPAHEEAPGWRAILAGFDSQDRAILVPLEGHFGELRVTTNNAQPGRGMMHGAADQQHRRDEVDFDAACTLALSTALTFGLEGRA